MGYAAVALIAFLTAGMTLFSGFGLGTLLMPAMAFFFPLDIAVAITALVHFANNVLKLALLGKYADGRVLIRFGVPAFLFSFLGAALLTQLSELTPLFQYEIQGRFFQVTPMKLSISLLMIAFMLLESLPSLSHLSFDRKYLPIGGALSGLFGGLSGHQGALRSAFLIRCGLTKESFIGTGVVIACLVDFARIFVYLQLFRQTEWTDHGPLLLIATLSAFAGTAAGNRLVKKVTIQAVQTIVSILLLIVALGLGAGLI